MSVCECKSLVGLEFGLNQHELLVSVAGVATRSGGDQALKDEGLEDRHCRFGDK